MDRDIILLGAGASKKAGVPLAREMTQVLVDGLRSPSSAHSDLHDLAAYLIGELLAHKSRAGEMPIGPFAGVDVEELANAVRDLRDRDQLELSAFVGSWHPRLEQLDAEATHSRHTAALAQAVDEAASRVLSRSLHPQAEVFGFGSSSDFERHFDAAVRDVIAGRGRGIRLGRLYSALLGALVKRSILGPTADVDYLRPLFNALGRTFWPGYPPGEEPLLPGGLAGTRLLSTGEIVHSKAPLVIATLNYDNALELAAERAGVRFELGLESWNTRRRFELSAKPGASALLILKLHGSADWRLENDRLVREGRGPVQLIFGGRNKLTAEGPFLDLFIAFAEALDGATRLTTVGYSFRDPHVNALIAKWRRREPGRVLRVVAPDIEDFFPIQGLDRWGRRAIFGNYGYGSPVPNLETVRGRAEDVLAELFPKDDENTSPDASARA